MAEAEVLSVMVFIDAAELLAGLGDAAEGTDLAALPVAMATERAAATLSPSSSRLRYAGAIVYTLPEHAHQPGDAARAAAVAAMAAAPGVEVRLVPDRALTMGECRACSLGGTSRCNHCRNVDASPSVFGGPIAEAMALDLFRLGREATFDVAVIVAAGRGLAPVFRFLEERGKKVVIGALPGVSPGA